MTKLCVFLAIGESFADFAKKGQDSLLIKQNLAHYTSSFDSVVVFSYGNEEFSPIKNVKILPNRWKIHRFLYSLLLPILYRKQIQSCDVIRCLQLTGGIPGVIAHILFKKKYIINYGYRYDKNAANEGKWLHMWLYKLIEPIIFFHAWSIIVTTDSLKQSLIKKTKKPIYIIPNGVDIELFSFRANKVKSSYILYVGRIEKSKNLEALVYAVGICKKKYTLFFVGWGQEKNHLLEIAKSYDTKLVILDAVPHHDLPKYYREASLFVLPSLGEGNPKVLLEAMSSGIPVVGTNVRGIRELVHHRQNGILCGTEPQEIASAIDWVLDHPSEAKKMSIKARTMIEKSFTLSTTMAKEVALLKKGIE